jgi:ABC-2 type transport system permease protein
MIAAIVVEWWKLKRSPVPVTATALMIVLLPAMGLGFFSVAQQDGIGAVGQKAQAMLVGEGWAGYVGAVNQIAAAAMFVGSGVVVAWMFGREHADRTFPALFALPVSRATVAAAKFIVLGGWAIVLSALVAVMATCLGFAADVGTFDIGIHGPEVVRLFMVGLSTTNLALTIGFVASVGRGYLPAIGALVLILIAAQMSVLFGTGGWFPFAVPGLLAVADHEGIPALNAAQAALVPMTAILGIWATVRWWKHAEVA